MAQRPRLAVAMGSVRWTIRTSLHPVQLQTKKCVAFFFWLGNFHIHSRVQFFPPSAYQGFCVVSVAYTTPTRVISLKFGWPATKHFRNSITMTIWDVAEHEIVCFFSDVFVIQFHVFEYFRAHSYCARMCTNRCDEERCVWRVFSALSMPSFSLHTLPHTRYIPICIRTLCYVDAVFGVVRPCECVRVCVCVCVCERERVGVCQHKTLPHMMLRCHASSSLNVHECIVYSMRSIYYVFANIIVRLGQERLQLYFKLRDSKDALTII